MDKAVRAIVVDGENWKWSVHKKPDCSEYTPCDERTMTLHGPDGYRRTFHLDFDTDAITPARVAEIVREKKKTWPDVES